MQFGLLSLGDHRADPATGHRTTQSERHANIVEYLDAAEPLGFDTVVAGEHHFGDFIMSVPQMFLSRIAGRTSAIRLASGVTLLPHHDPVRVAEDFATLDVLSGGRAELWVGKGVEPAIYEKFGQDRHRSAEMQDEGLELLTRLWTEHNVSWSGEFRPPLDNATVEPRPVQDPHPPIYVASGSLGSAVAAGQAGFGLTATALSAELRDLGEASAAYRDAFVGRHRDAKSQISMTCHVHVAPTTQEARDHLAIYQPPFQKWVFSKRMGVPAESVELPRRITDFAWNNCAVICGSPEEVTDRVGRVAEVTGCDRVIAQMDYGGQPWPKVMRSLDLFSSEVMPQLRD